MAKSKLVKANERTADAVVGGYKKIENGVVGGYKKIEEGVTGTFQKVEDGFEDRFLTHEGGNCSGCEKTSPRGTGSAGDDCKRGDGKTG